MTTVLAVNAGSSSLKTALFRDGARSPERLLSVAVPRLGTDELVVHRADGATETRAVTGSALGAVLSTAEGSGERPAVVVHRFVHGGPTLTGPPCSTPTSSRHCGRSRPGHRCTNPRPSPAWS